MTDVSCTGCEIGRRAFLREAAVTVAAIAATLGVPADALARTVGPTPPPAERGRARLYPIPAQDGVVIDRENDVILVRWEGALYAFNLACPHQRVALRWLERDGRFQCPKHKSKYRPDGTFIEGRATRGMDRFPVRREGDTIAVDVGQLIKQSDDAAGWTAAVLRV
jgi:nitrite reductase/ring-hydroxylating ferredoxin subunit